MWMGNKGHISRLKSKRSQLHGIPGLITLKVLLTRTHGAARFRSLTQNVFQKFCTEAKDYFDVCFNTVVGDWTVPQRHYFNDVYDSGMVFYNVLFLDEKLFTLHSSVFAIFCSYKSTNVNSIFAMLESP